MSSTRTLSVRHSLARHGSAGRARHARMVTYWSIQVSCAEASRAGQRRTASCSSRLSHNYGGTITVTAKMKKFFWHKYYEATQSFGRKKDGSPRKDKRTVQLNAEAEFWKFMALKKAGTTIKIPRRRFLGTSPEVEQAVRNIIEENLEGYIEEAISFSIKES